MGALEVNPDEERSWLEEQTPRGAVFGVSRWCCSNRQSCPAPSMCRWDDGGIPWALQRGRWRFLQAEEQKRPQFPPPHWVFCPGRFILQDNHGHCCWSYPCLGITSSSCCRIYNNDNLNIIADSWSFSFLNKTSKRGAVLGRWLFWREDFGVSILSNARMQPKEGCDVLERGFVYIYIYDLSLIGKKGFGFYFSRKCPKMWGIAPPGHRQCSLDRKSVV